jgi:hypothetical protein
MNRAHWHGFARGARGLPLRACLQMQKEIRTNLLIFLNSASEKPVIAGESR